MSDTLATLFERLSPEQKDALKQLLFAEMANESNIADAPGQVMVWNRSPDQFEFQWDSRTYQIPGHKFAVYETGIARQAVRKGQYLHVGTPDVQEWIVVKGHPEFGKPMLTNGLTGDPVKDYPIDLRPVPGEPDVPEGAQEKYSLDRLPPPPASEPKPVAKKIPHDNSVGHSEGAKIQGAVRA